MMDDDTDIDTNTKKKSLDGIRLGATIVNITIPFLRGLHLGHAFKIVSEFGLTLEGPFYNKSYVLEPNTEFFVKTGRTLTADEILAQEKMRTFGI